MAAVDKKSLSERDICTKFITPAIEGADWDLMTQVREEVYFTAGRVIVRGKTVKRGEAKRADYILFRKPNIPLAVIEAKDNNRSLGAGMQQALGYAGILDVPSNVRHDNTLARPLREYRPRDRVDAIVANPPFGGMKEDGIESNFPKTFRTRETADLFLVLIIHLLKPGGRGAIVLPDGTLFGEGVKTRIKEKLLDECNLHTIVRLPNGVFSPYTGIKTNLLFFTKGEPTRDIWFYEHPYPPGYKSYSKTKPIRINEFKPEKKWWGKPDVRGGFKGRKANEQVWKVSAADIKAGGYNLDIKNPHDADTGSGDPDELLAELERIRREGQQTLARLKQELAVALSDR